MRKATERMSDSIQRKLRLRLRHWFNGNGSGRSNDSQSYVQIQYISRSLRHIIAQKNTHIYRVNRFRCDFINECAAYVCVAVFSRSFTRVLSFRCVSMCVCLLLHHFYIILGSCFIICCSQLLYSFFIEPNTLFLKPTHATSVNMIILLLGPRRYSKRSVVGRKGV